MGISCRFEHISFCAGWALKALHTIFDYLVQTRRSDTECGKALAGCKTKFRDEIYGGYPPMMEMITTEPEIAEECMNYLFSGKAMNENTKRMVFPTMLRFYDDCIECIKLVSVC